MCSALKSTLTGTGEDRNTITVTQNSDGAFRVLSQDDISGTATDANGNNYIFIYQNKMTIDSVTALATQPAPPYDFHGPDTFQLFGVNGAQSYNVAQYFRTHINADGMTFNDLGSMAANDPFCDPI